MSNQFSDISVKKKELRSLPSSWFALVDSCRVISILPLMSAGIVCSHLYAQCVFTLEEIRHEGGGARHLEIICIIRTGYVWVCVRMVGILCAWGGAIPPSSLSF